MPRIRTVKPEFWADVELSPENQKVWELSCPMEYATEYLYRAHGEHGELLYVGITACPYNRFTSHRRKSPWWPETRLLEVWRVRASDPLEANTIISRWETRCIAEQQPLWNVQRRPNWRAHANQEY